MAANFKSRERQQLFDKIQHLTAVPGTTTPWLEVENGLRRVSTPALRGLVYRIERAIENSYNDGVSHGRAAESNTCGEGHRRP